MVMFHAIGEPNEDCLCTFHFNAQKHLLKMRASSISTFEPIAWNSEKWLGASKPWQWKTSPHFLRWFWLKSPWGFPNGPTPSLADLRWDEFHFHLLRKRCAQHAASDMSIGFHWYMRLWAPKKWDNCGLWSDIGISLESVHYIIMFF